MSFALIFRDVMTSSSAEQMFAKNIAGKVPILFLKITMAKINTRGSWGRGIRVVNPKSPESIILPRPNGKAFRASPPLTYNKLVTT